MKITGKKENGKKDFLLQNISIVCNISELDKLIEFFACARNDLAKASNYSYDEVLEKGEDTIYPHRHLQFWDQNWNENMPDIEIITPFKARKKKDGEVVWESSSERN